MFASYFLFIFPSVCHMFNQVKESLFNVCNFSACLALYNPEGFFDGKMNGGGGCFLEALGILF